MSSHGDPVFQAPEPAPGEAAGGAGTDSSAFIVMAYKAVLERVPSAEDVGLQIKALNGGLTHAEFIESLLASPERQSLVATREADRTRASYQSAQAVADFILFAYRAVFGRDPDEEGLETSIGYFAEGGSHADFLDRLMQSEEARLKQVERGAQQEESHDRSRELERIVRLAFHGILNRDVDSTALDFYMSELDERMTPGDFLAALVSSPERQHVRKQQGMGPALAACGSIATMLEGQLRKRGVTLNLGPMPPFDAPSHLIEKTLYSLVATVEMLCADDHNLADRHGS